MVYLCCHIYFEVLAPVCHVVPFLISVTVFNEGPQADVTETASQSVPMIATSTSNLTSTVESGGGDDGDEVFIEGADQEG